MERTSQSSLRAEKRRRRSLVYYVTHGSLRYRHPIDPIVLLLTAIAVNGARGADEAARAVDLNVTVT